MSLYKKKKKEGHRLGRQERRWKSANKKRKEKMGRDLRAGRGK